MRAFRDHVASVQTPGEFYDIAEEFFPGDKKLENDPDSALLNREWFFQFLAVWPLTFRRFFQDQHGAVGQAHDLFGHRT